MPKDPEIGQLLAVAEKNAQHVQTLAINVAALQTVIRALVQTVEGDERFIAALKHHHEAAKSKGLYSAIVDDDLTAIDQTLKRYLGEAARRELGL